MTSALTTTTEGTKKVKNRSGTLTITVKQIVKVAISNAWPLEGF